MYSKTLKKVMERWVLLLLSTFLVINNAFSQDRTIPTVVHVIKPNQQSDLLTDAQIADGIKNLNAQFSGDYANSLVNDILLEHQNNIADSNIRFQLATIDEDGNPTNGITRTVNNAWSTNALRDEDALKTQLHWDRSSYLNIYVYERHNENNGSGMAWRPDEVNTLQTAVKDGVMVTYRIWPHNFPFEGNQWAGFEGTMAHELGHYLNLYHTWGQTNNAQLQCNDDLCDDLVDDTPKHSSSLNGNAAGTQSIECNNLLAMVDNFMTYSRHQCLFTQGQVNRMRNALDSVTASRNNLWTDANLIATGTRQYCNATGAQDTADGYINNVAVGSIDHDSDKTQYSNFRWINTEVEQEKNYTLYITLDRTSQDDQAYAWVDWNNDGVFNDANESIAMGDYNNLVSEGIINVPANANLGPVTLRVRNIRANPNNGNSCDDIVGEVEDYTLIVTAPTQYCIATGAIGTVNDYINNVTIGDINKNSNQSQYSDFIAQQSTNVARNQSYNLSITLNATFPADQAYAWVDWNNDGDFNDVNESIVMGAYDNSVSEGMINVPANANLGPVRLRVRNIWANPNIGNPCNNFFGEVEDYTLNIQRAEVPPQIPVALTNNNNIGVNLHKEVVTLFPNPTRNIINLKTSFDSRNYQVYDVQGKIINRGVLNSKKNILDFSKFNAGVYFLKILNDNGEAHFKKVIKE